MITCGRGRAVPASGARNSSSARKSFRDPHDLRRLPVPEHRGRAACCLSPELCRIDQGGEVRVMVHDAVRTGTEQDKRDALGRFPAGVSGNCGGRPRALRRMVELAREQTEESIQKLVSLRDTAKSEMVRLLAAEALLNRGWGKSPQVVNLSEDGD